MFLIPYRKVSIRTGLSSQEVKRRLSPIVGPGKDFAGKFAADGFKIRRNKNNWGRDSYLPVIQGRFKPIPNGTEVTLSFRPRPVQAALLVAIFGFAEYLAIAKDTRMWWWPIAAFPFA